MPFPIASAISAASSLIGAGLSTYVTNKANAANRQYNADMYARERKDNLEFWRMQNEYNTPAAQMQRMKDAGISPLLPFLSGSGVGASSAGPIKDASTKNYDQKVPDLSGIANAGTRAIDAMYSLEVKNAQLDNLKAQNNNILTDTALKASNAIRSKTSNEGEVLRNTQFARLMDTSVQAAREGLRQMTMANDWEPTRQKLMLDQNEMQKASNASNLAEAAERIAMSRIEQSMGKYRAEEYREKIKLLLQQQKLNQFELNLNQFGQTKNDDMIWRILGTLTDSLMQRLGIPKF